ncbi:MAG TPA: hypothetical protein VLR27_17875 [Acidimicrobiales bacterium]|nr:hypothetical protein [Acidimicrobiales bacterium]
MRTLLRTFAPLLLVLAVACGDDDDTTAASTTTAVPSTTTESTSTTTEAADPVDEDAAPYRVTVEDPGQEPRRELRLVVDAGDTDQVTLRQETSLEVDAGGQVQSAPSPVNEFDVSYTIDEVDGDRFTATGVYDDVRVLDAPGVDPAVADELRSLMEGFRDARARTTFTSRGGIVEAELEGLELPGAAGAFAEQLAGSFTDSAESMSLPFPDEAIGQGARWRVDTETEIAGMPVEITTVVSLAELGEDRAAGTIEQTLRFVPGNVQVMGVAAEVISGELTGGGPIEWDLADGIVPRSDITIAGTAVMEANGVRIEQRQQQRITYLAR